MNNSRSLSSSVSIFDYQEVDWLPWMACPYADSLAVFRFMVTDLASANIAATRLQPDEIQRANRYHRLADRNRFVCGRHLLRVLLSQYTAQLPGKIAFTTGKNRKPDIADTTDWHFNVSHSGDWVLIAVARSCVGVDVEFRQPTFAYQPILPTSFTAPEQQFIQTHPNPSLAFYRLWTRKEALVKATGKGVDDDFPIIPSLTGVHQFDSRVLGATGDWFVHSFDATNDYPAAVAYSTGLEMAKFYTVDGGFFAHFTS